MNKSLDDAGIPGSDAKSITHDNGDVSDTSNEVGFKIMTFKSSLFKVICTVYSILYDGIFL